MNAAFAAFSDAVREQSPRTAVVLGSGLGNLGEQFRVSHSIPFTDIPGLHAPSVGGHSGRLALGDWSATPALVLFGRVHGYEGRSWEEVTAPVRLAASLGVKRMVLTNAAGGIHPTLEPGSLMALRGHMTLLDNRAWQSLHIACPYSSPLVQHLQSAGLLAGVYAALTGPCYETPAEIRALRTMGADAVGMSTAREAEAAAELGMEVAAISCITNHAAGLGGASLDHAEVLATAKLAASRLFSLIAELV